VQSGTNSERPGRTMTETAPRSFDDLLENVISAGLCGKCGGCVSVCSANMIGALTLDAEGFPVYEDREKCLDCGLCYMVCPNTNSVLDEVKARFNWKSPIGHHVDLYPARSTDRDVLKAATDGGVVTSLLMNMLESGYIDGAVVSSNSEGGRRKAIVATSAEELLQAAGSHFGELPHLEEVGENYSNYVSVIRYATKSAPVKLNKLAVVGTPCQIAAIRNMQALAIVPSDIVIFTIGLFCMQCFEMDHLLDKAFLTQWGVSREDIRSMNIKENFILTMQSGLKVQIPMEEIEQIARTACLKCTYFANDYADVSVGGLGSPDGYTSVMVRTIRGKMMMADAISKERVEKKERGWDKQSMITLIEEFASRKRSRGERYLADILKPGGSPDGTEIQDG